MLTKLVGFVVAFIVDSSAALVFNMELDTEEVEGDASAPDFL